MVSSQGRHRYHGPKNGSTWFGQHCREHRRPFLGSYQIFCSLCVAQTLITQCWWLQCLGTCHTALVLFVLCFGFGVLCVFFFVFCVLLVFGAWFLFVFCFGSVLVTLRLNAGLCIGPLPVHFMRPLIRRQPANAVINQLILFCDIQLNM